MEGSTVNYTILEAVIGTIGAIVVAMLSSVITYIVARYNFRTPKTRNLLEEQYKKVLVPLHKLVFIQPGNMQDKIKKSVEIVLEEYEYVPIKIISDLRSLLENEDKNKFDEYAKNVNKALIVARKKLGYDLRQKGEELSPYFTNNNDNPVLPPTGPRTKTIKNFLNKLKVGKGETYIVSSGKIKEDTPIGRTENEHLEKATR